jgi:hypothetical protein
MSAVRVILARAMGEGSCLTKLTGMPHRKR